MHYQYVNQNTLLLVTAKGALRKLHTPFRVECVTINKQIPIGTWVYVDEVWTNGKDELLFLIYGQPHSHRHFKIIT